MGPIENEQTRPATTGLSLPLQQELIEQRDSTDAFLTQRSKAIKEIEIDIQQVAQMFGKLGTLVQQQHDLAQRIDTNISDALTNLDQTQTELNKYLSKVMSNRGLILKIFLVLVVFVIIVALFLV